VKINIELRDLDFKKNLELKTKLCEAAERLMNNENIIEASRALQQLHEEWAEIGPVARELREEIWERFKTASTAINKKHQAYFDALHAKEQDNLARKQELVARMQHLVDQTATQAKEQGSKIWEEATKQVLEIQTEWRTIGFAPKKFNQSIYEQYRDLCDAFFKAKNAYFKELREQYKLRAEQRKAREEQRKLRAEQRAEQKAAKSDDQLRRIREKLKQEIQTAENNILFFTAKSKTANKLVDSMQEKINQLKKQLDDINSRLDQ
jgi:chromosome segregation ATPase